MNADAPRGQHQRAAIDWSTARRVLLIRLRSIGDTVLMTPCLAALKSWRADVAVAVVSETLSAPLLEGHPLVDSQIIAGGNLSSRARLIGALRRQRFDVAFNMHGGTTSTLIAALSGARHTVGYQGYRYSWMLGNRAPSPDQILGRQQIHSVEQQLALLYWAGVPWPEKPKLNLAVSAQAEAAVLAKLASTSSWQPGPVFAVIAPWAASESKRWLAAGFADVVDHLHDYWKLPSVVIAGPGQEHIAREVCETAESKPPRLTGLNLTELTALLARARVFVGNDSGPAHVAAAFERPIVVVFGCSEASVWRPWTEAPSRVVQAQPSSPIKQVQVKQALSAVDEVMEAALEAESAGQL